MKIFISYRRVEDNKSYIVGVIHEKLSERFDKENVFQDTYDINPGTEWKERLEREVNSCKVMLIIIGPDWTNLAHPNAQKRLFDPEDITRWEIETGIRQSREKNILLIPVRVNGSSLPTTEELHPNLQELTKLQAISSRNFPDFDTDMGKYPVTYAEFEAYIRKTGISVPIHLGWDGQKVCTGKEAHPVIAVTWMEAMAYCQWWSGETGREFPLPNDAQWEKACRGGKNTFYPWGDTFDVARSNQGRSELAGVKTYPEQNEFGCFDFVGNVRQWTISLWGEKRIAPDTPYAYPWREDRRNDINASRQIRRVVRGSSYRDPLLLMRCSVRSGQATEDPGLPDARYGFRVVMNV